MKKRGKLITCTGCSGHGVVSGYTIGGTDFLGPEECNECGGNGTQYMYSNGSLAMFKGGPMRGRICLK